MPHTRRMKSPAASVGFTPDNFPVFDVFRGNVYVIADLPITV